MKWEILNSTHPFKCKWLSVRKDKVRMPSGYEMDDFYVLEYPHFVNVIAITEDGLFLIEKQYRHGLQKVSFELCAGCVEKGESPLDAAKRELSEETGYSSEEWNLFMISAPNPNSMNNLCYTFLAKNVKKTSNINRELSEDIQLHLCTKEEIKDKLYNNLIIEGVMQAPLWKYIYENK